MSDETKLMLSGDELAMAADPSVILTKRAVMQKASALFTALIPALQDTFLPVLSGYPALVSSIPKISKGENYRGFPYVIMDHPAAFEKDNIFALRTMFWWGHFISITLHISGKYKQVSDENILNKINNGPFFIAVGEAEWEHHFEEDNFRPVSSLTETEKEQLIQKSFFKIALKYKLADWNRMPGLLAEGYGQMAALLK
jgi:hypothetical protein